MSGELTILSPMIYAVGDASRILFCPTQSGLDEMRPRNGAPLL
jgi:hypothetical protein